MTLEEFKDWMKKNPNNTDEIIDTFVLTEEDVDRPLKEWLDRINKWAGNEKNNSHE